MKYWLSITLLLIFSGITTAQPTQISIIDFYGLQKISEQTIRKQLKVKEGDSIQNINKQWLINQLESIPGIYKADVGAVCCDDKDGKWIIYIGIAESPVSKHGYNATPTGSDSLPDQTIKDYEEFMGMVYEAVTKGESGENRTNGYSFMTYPPAKEVQERMIKYAQNNQQQIRQVLLKSSKADHRQAAAWMVAYFPDRNIIVNDLIHAVNDADEVVRNNATRGLATLAAYLNEHPDPKVSIPAEPFIALANSVVWTDRNKGIAVLLGLTENRPPALMKQLKDKLLNSLVEMSKWKNPGHAMMSYTVLSRLAGVEEDKINSNYVSDRKDALIQEMIQQISRQNKN